MKIDTSGFPMMSKREVEYIRGLIDDNSFNRCLEWGGGNSTLYFPFMCPSITRWDSIEHNGHYIKYFQGKLSPSVAMFWVPENEWYVDCVRHQGKIYDFILVDGLFREQCLELAFDLIKKGGAIVLHDSGRREYQNFIRKYSHKKIFDGEIEDGNGFYVHRGITIFNL